MSGRRSLILSVALVALGSGCYAEPDIEITAIRNDVSFHVRIDACRDTCKGNLAFTEDMGTVRSVFVFVNDDGPNIRLKFFRADSGDWERCITLQLGGDRVRRKLELVTADVTTWTCDAGVQCEDFEMCPP